MRSCLVLSAASLLLAACDSNPSPAPTPAPGSPTPSASAAAGSGAEPDYISVQHVLIAFEGSGTAAKRSKAEAEELAKKVLDWARGGARMEELMAKYSDDTGGGTYSMSNHGAKKRPNGYERKGMVPAFGNVGFKLKVGEVGMSVHHPKDSPYGWHIIKRVE